MENTQPIFDAPGFLRDHSDLASRPFLSVLISSQVGQRQESLKKQRTKLYVYNVKTTIYIANYIDDGGRNEKPHDIKNRIRLCVVVEFHFSLLFLLL
jgi:hypothetical protein